MDAERTVGEVFDEALKADLDKVTPEANALRVAKELHVPVDALAAAETQMKLDMAKLRGEIERELKPLFNKYKNRRLKGRQLKKLLTAVMAVFLRRGIDRNMALTVARATILHSAPSHNITVVPVEAAKGEGDAEPEEDGQR